MWEGESKVAENNGYAKNVEVLGYHDLGDKPAFQMAMQEVEGRYYLYTASYKANGWSILEVTDPANPHYIQFLKGPDIPDQGTPKIQVADGGPDSKENIWVLCTPCHRITHYQRIYLQRKNGEYDK